MARILILMLLLGLFLRVVDIDNNPKAIYGDGLTLVYDAYSILKTGHDQKGNFLPFIFKLGDHRPPAYVYATIPFVALFGPTALSANSASILSGLGIIFLLFWLGRYFYLAEGGSPAQAQRVGLVAALLGVTSAWDLSLSRGPFETHLALFLALLGVYFFLKSRKKPIFLFLSSISFGLSSLTYPTYGLTAPLLLIFLLIFDKRGIDFFKTNSKVATLAAITSLIFILLSFNIVHSGDDPSRVEAINIFSRPEIRRDLAQQISTDRALNTGPWILTNLMHNYFWSYGTLVFENYVENFRPSFLLINGDLEPRHNPAEIGQLFWATGILAVLGLVFLYGKKTLFLLLGWLLIAPAATALISPPHALRDSLMLPPLLLLAAFGVEKIFHSRRWFRKLVMIFILVLYLGELIFFIDRFYLIAPNKFARFWAYPAKEASDIALKEKQSYDFVLLSARIDNMEFAYPVYAKLEPERVIAQNKQATKLGEYQFINYDNVYIGSIQQQKIKEFIKSLPGTVLYLGPPEEGPFVDGVNTPLGPDLLPSLIRGEKR